MKLPFPRVRGSQSIYEAVKYTIGCGGGLLLKVLITSAATYFRLPLSISYLIATVSILFFSFFFLWRST